LVNAPASCAVDFRPPGELDPQTAAALATIPAEQRALPANLAGINAQWANSFTVTCGGTAPTPVAIAAPAELTAGGGPLGIAPPETGGGANWGGPLAPLFAKIAAWQSDFYSRLTTSLGDLDDNLGALWLLLGLSFLYGVFHAAGPGHGKAVITAYLLASGETLRRGVVIAFAAAFVQATVAILLAAIVFWILNLTASAMTNVTNFLEIGSYALIVAIGAWLLWTRLRGHRHVHAHALGAAAARHGGHHDAPHDHGHHGHAHHDHAGHDDHDHGHSHAPDPRRLGARLTFASAWAAILAVGIRPCTGALIVLSFALAQGLFLAGVASTLVMAVGTGLTVAALATLAVVARDAALRLTGRRSAAIALVGRTIEIGGALAVLGLGLVLLGGALSAAA
jgi:ABC-type nickel/cobalt efflux system permease component RcnA